MCRDAGVDFTVHMFDHDPRVNHFGDEAARALAVVPGQVFKTLIMAVDQTPVCVLVPVTHQASLKAVAAAHGGKRASMLPSDQAMRLTGYVVGGVSPLGQRKKLRTYLDLSALDYPTIYFCGGKRGLEIEMAPSDLQRLTDARLIDLRGTT